MAGTTAAGLGFAAGQVVQEFGWDDDVDDEVRVLVEDETGADLVEEDYGDVTDGALIWWREDDGEVDDLADVLMDAQANLDDGGLIWVLTPKAGRVGNVRAGDVEEAARTAGLSATSAAAVGSWSGFRLTSRGRGR